MSVGQLVDAGYKLHFEDGLCIIKDCNGAEMISIAMKNHSFPLYLNESSNIAYTSVEDQSSLMHKRLGHCSYSTLREITRHGLIEDMPSVTQEDCVCRVCEEGKSSRASFSSDSVKRAKVKLELVHSDVCGPMSIESLSGSRFFLLFIDDFSRRTWCYFLKNKFEVFDSFVNFRAQVENDVGVPIKTLRTDNGGEYTSFQFEDYLRKNGISV